jgi:hypothetical protein
MEETVIHRGVRSVENTAMAPGGSATHRIRTVLDFTHWEDSDPFLMLNEDWFTTGTFADHPHRGIETITYVIEGELRHFDNHGGKGSLHPGDAQWMTAGRGVIHNEDAHPEKPLHTLQLWINLPAAAKMTDPRYQDLRGTEVPVRRLPGAELRVFSGASGNVRASTLNHVPITMVDMRLDAHATVTQDIPAADNGFLYVLGGSGRFGVDRTPARSGQVVWLSRAAGEGRSEFTVQADEPLHAILWSGRPLQEPVVHYGPFVMNTEDQIMQAIEDFRAGKF